MRQIVFQIQKGDQEAIKAFVDKLNELPNKIYELVIRNPQRTERQNRSLRLFEEWVCEALNEIGEPYHLRVLGRGLETVWTPNLVHEGLWKPIQIKMFDKDSSTKLSTKEVSDVADVIRDLLANKQIIMNFPNELDLYLGVKNYQIL